MKKSAIDMAKMNENKIIHRDIKPENLMVDYDEKKKQVGEIGFIDYDLSCVI